MLETITYYGLIGVFCLEVAMVIFLLWTTLRDSPGYRETRSDRRRTAIVRALYAQTRTYANLADSHAWERTRLPVHRITLLIEAGIPADQARTPAVRKLKEDDLKTMAALVYRPEPQIDPYFGF